MLVKDLSDRKINLISDEDMEDIAFEVMVAKKFVKRKHEDNWQNTEEYEGMDYPNKKSLTQLLSKHNLIDRYVESNEEHFDEDGNWEATHLIPAAHYILRVIIDEEVVKTDAVRKKYLTAAEDINWIKDAIGHLSNKIGIYMAEEGRTKGRYLKEKVRVIEERRALMDELISDMTNRVQKSVQKMIDTEYIKDEYKNDDCIEDCVEEFSDEIIEDKISKLCELEDEKELKIESGDYYITELKLYEKMAEELEARVKKETEIKYNGQQRLCSGENMIEDIS